MQAPSLDDLRALAAVARAGSFRRAAAQLGLSQPALSRTVKALEQQLGARLLNRTTRSVAPTYAGAELLREIEPALVAVADAIARVREGAGEISGTVRITASRHGYESVLRHSIAQFLGDHPKAAIEVALDDAFVDVVATGFDAGLRLGNFVEKDMVAVRVGPDVEFAVVGSPQYLAAAGVPVTPQGLAAHRCIGYRSPRTAEIYPWQFERAKRRSSVRIDPRLLLNDGDAILAAALDGVGLAYLFLDQVAPAIENRSLERVLSNWCPPQPGYHLYYSSRRHQPPIQTALVSHLRKFSDRS